MSVSVKMHIFCFLGIIFFLLSESVASADMLATSAVISSVAKHEPQGSHDISLSVAQTRTQAVSRHLVETAKRRPALNHSSRNFETISPTGLRNKLSSRSAIIMDSDSGRVLYAHEPDLTGQPASTIKVLTGLIAMKSLGDSAKVKVSHKASKMPRSKVYLSQGRDYKANDLINAVLLSSANDASVALAEKVAGSEQTFVKLMNYKAAQLGARSTVCKSASGLTVRGQRSTVRDLATIFNGAMKDEEFAQRIGKVRARTSYGRLLNNHNKALWRIDGAKGGKTGYTHLARQTYVGMFERDGKAITVAIMGSETMWDDVSNLVEFGFVRRDQLVAAGKMTEKFAPIASLLPLSEDQGSSAEEDVAVPNLILSQISKHRKM